MTPKQSELYAYLLSRIDNPVGPTYAELGEVLNVQSRSSVHRMVQSLKRQGRVVTDPNRQNSIHAVRDNPFDGIPTADLVSELRRRGNIREMDRERVAEMLIDFLYGEGTGAHWLQPQYAEDYHAITGRRGADRIIDYLISSGAINGV